MADLKPFIVAVVDDDTRILRSLESLLASAGHEARLFTSAETFLQQDAIKMVDCLISDIGMPGMNGLDLRNVAALECPELPIFLLTGNEELLGFGITAHQPRDRLFLKPVRGLELLEAIEVAMRSFRHGR